MLSTFISTPWSPDVDAVCGAASGQVSDDRTNRRGDYRHRDFDTRGETIGVAIPEPRSGTYFPQWLLQHRRHAEQGKISVVATFYVFAASFQLGITSLSKSQVSGMAKGLRRAGEGLPHPSADERPVPVPRRRRA